MISVKFAFTSIVAYNAASGPRVGNFSPDGPVQSNPGFVVIVK